MKKFVFKATALAIGALVGGGAFAAVASAPIDFDSSAAGATAKVFAKELAYVNATPLAPAAGEANWASKLGFGVSNGQTRYIRIDYTNATLDAVHAAANTDIEVVASSGGTTIGGGAASATIALVQGGQVGDSYAVYQISATADLNALAQVRVKTPALRVASNDSSVTVKYSLHETAASAQGATAANTAVLFTASKAVATFAAGLKWTLTPGTSTAMVEQSFKKFSDGAATPTAIVARALGTVKLAPAATTLDNLASQITLAQLVDLAAGKTNAVIKGDFGAVTNDGAATPVNDGVFLQSGGTCAAPAGKLAGVTNAAKTAATIDLAAVDVTKTYDVCYTVTGTVAIPAQTVTAELDLTAAAGTATVGVSSAADVAAASVGTIDRDGTELQAPFVTIHPDYLSRVVLTSQHSSDAAVTFSAITEDGVTVPTINAGATLKAGKQLVVNVKDIVPSLSAGTRFALKAIIAAPKSKIEGVYNVMNYDATTGKTNSLISYQLARPAN